MSEPQKIDEQQIQQVAKRRRQRNVALALVLAGLVLVFYVLTIAKMGPAIFNRAL
jgi:hypothetical protein